MSDREWITDRLPTEADADEDGDVCVRNRPEAVPSGRPYFHWSMVLPGMAWCHTDIWEAPTKPALAAGQRWRRRDGEVVTITEHDTSNDTDYPFRAGGHWYRVDGTSCIDDSNADLVELIEPAAELEPVTTTRRFVSISRTDWTAEASDGYTLDAIADDGTAWWKHSYQAQWTQHTPLPDCEVPRF